MEKFAPEELVKTLEQSIHLFTQPIETNFREKIAFYNEQLVMLQELREGLIQSLRYQYKNLSAVEADEALQAPVAAAAQERSVEEGLRKIESLASALWEDLRKAPVVDEVAPVPDQPTVIQPPVVEEDPEVLMARRHYQGLYSVFADYLSASIYLGGRGDINTNTLPIHAQALDSTPVGHLAQWPDGFYTTAEGALELMIGSGGDAVFQRFILSPVSATLNTQEPSVVLKTTDGAFQRVEFAKLPPALLLPCCKLCETALFKHSKMANEGQQPVVVTGQVVQPDEEI